MVEKVTLIYPESRRYTGFLSTHRFPGFVTSHAGLTMLAQILDRRGIATRVYDEAITPFHPRMIDGADLVGVSIQTSWAPQGYRIARAAKRLGKPVVIGGVHATLNPEEAILHADYVVRGEGEHTLPELVDALEGRRALSTIAGLSYWDHGEAKHNDARAPMTTEELDALPWPRFELIHGFYGRAHPVNPLVYFTMLTRGCDQACRYCSITRVFGRALRHRSVGNVIEELGARFDPKRQFLFFMDDSLAVDTDYLKEVLAAMVSNKLVPVHGWHSQLRADVARDPELLRLMRATNCMFVTCGFESLDPRNLRSLGKGQSPDDVKRAIAKLREQDIVVNGFFMFGMDEDEPAAMVETAKFARESGCTLAGFMPLTPFPDTPTYEALDRDGRIFTRDWELYDVQHVVFHPKRMSALELYWGTLRCYPAFYRARDLMRMVPTAIARNPPLAVLLIGATWPFVKNASWAREVAANLDYLRALRRMDGGRRGAGTEFPHLEPRRLWAKDLVSGRAVRRWSSRLAAG